MKASGILAIITGGALLFFGAVVGFETGLGLRIMNLPMAIMGGVLFLAGIILYVAGSQGSTNVTPPAAPKAAFDTSKWNALVKYDEEIALIADKLKPLGQKWVDEFASSYLALNDKSHLPNLVRKIIADARKEDDLPQLEGKENLAFELSHQSMNILRRAKENGYEVELSQKDECVVVRRKGIKGTWYLGSNSEIDDFAKQTSLT